MKHRPAMYALIRLHAEIAGKIIDNKTEAERLAEDCKHVEAVLRMLEPGFDVTTIAARRRYKANEAFRRGECFRAALDVLRAAGEPMKVAEISRRVLASRGITSPSSRVFYTMQAAVRSSLMKHEGRTVRRVNEGMPARWTTNTIFGK